MPPTLSTAGHKSNRNNCSDGGDKEYEVTRIETSVYRYHLVYIFCATVIIVSILLFITFALKMRKVMF